MELVSKKNTLILLAAILVVALGIMAYVLTKQRIKSTPQKPDTFSQDIQKINTQSNSDDPQAIEKDLNETDFTDINKDLQNIDKEIQGTL